jgi:Spy/CpxP family protein refolding chaperone
LIVLALSAASSALAVAMPQRQNTSPVSTPSVQTLPPQTPTTSQAQAPSAPGQRGAGGMTFLWWNDERVKKDLALTPSQVKKINDIYEKRQTEIKPFADEINKQQTELDNLVRERQVDDSVIALQAARLEALRSPVNASRIVMLYRIYRVLTPAQNDLLRPVLEKYAPGRGRGGALPAFQFAPRD